MFAKLIFWLLGSCDFYIMAPDANVAAQLLVASGANYRKLRPSEDRLEFSLRLSDCEPMLRIFAKHGIKATKTGEHGLAYLIRRYHRRYGIPIGVGMFAAILFLSEQFIWTIDVVGNDKIPAEQIVERLEALGYGVGSYIPRIDFDWLHNQYLIEHDDIAWMALNVRGTSATIEVRELKRHAPVPNEQAPHNLVAAEDGVVSYIEILRGTAVVRQDELVRAGELLASGIEDMKHQTRLVHARGKVLANVKRTIRIEVPLETTVRELTGVQYRERYLNIFGISVKLFGNTGNMPTEYDKIEREYPLCFFGLIEVPVCVREVIYSEYKQVPIELSEEQAKAEAYGRLRSECRSLLENCSIVSRKIEAGLLDGAYVIECELIVQTDIAKEVPIYTD